MHPTELQGLAVRNATTLTEAFEALRAGYARDRVPDRAWRVDKLTALEQMVRNNIDAFADAVSKDFGHRSRHETRLIEIFPSLEGIRYARRNVRKWMRPERRHASMWFRPGRASIEYQPLGVVGIIVPWNYPVFLGLGPMAAALAAGNRVMLKMSEHTLETSGLFARLIAQRFAPDEVAVILGDAEVGKAFSGLPFDHLLFTGSTQIGRHVMVEAATHLTPVTLELGGKSPAIVGPGYPIEHAATRIMSGKCLNAGQTCIAPDYALVPEGEVEAFVAAAKQFVSQAYPDILRSPDFTTIVNERQFRRLVGYCEEAAHKGARVVPLAAGDAHWDFATRRFPPVALLGGDDHMHVMTQEIFGPILPIVPYKTLDEAIAYVNARPRPLALYYFDRDGARVARVLRETVAGGVTINDTILHIAQDDLPFGGVGPSGMGAYHGREGFETFSHKKAVFRQSRLNGMGLFKPPYGKLFEAMVRLLIR
jgi:acyl-CoA reductase-like NAD-dependent aldehyde dehydrogenase